MCDLALWCKHTDSGIVREIHKVLFELRIRSQDATRCSIVEWPIIPTINPGQMKPLPFRLLYLTVISSNLSQIRYLKIRYTKHSNRFYAK